MDLYELHALVDMYPSVSKIPVSASAGANDHQCQRLARFGVVAVAPALRFRGVGPSASGL